MSEKASRRNLDYKKNRLRQVNYQMKRHETAHITLLNLIPWGR